MNELRAATAASGVLSAVGEFVPADAAERWPSEARRRGGPPNATAGTDRLLLDRPIQGGAAPPATDPTFMAWTRLA